jgi:hypothetical protein
MKKTKKTKYTTIRWLDHFSDSSWKTKSEIEKWATKPNICVTTGEITFQNEKVIVLSASFDGTDGYGENMCILKANIVK